MTRSGVALNVRRTETSRAGIRSLLETRSEFDVLTIPNSSYSSDKQRPPSSSMIDTFFNPAAQTLASGVSISFAGILCPKTEVARTGTDTVLEKGSSPRGAIEIDL